MGKIVISENVSLDGVVEDPSGVEGFSRGGWVGKVTDREGAAKVLLDEAEGAEAQLFGRRTYEFLAARWPSRTGALADRLNGMPKYVLSSTLEDPEWNNSTVLAGDVVEEVSKLREEIDGEIVVAGSIRFVRMLMENDLVDELRLMIYPVVLGAGERLFGELPHQKGGPTRRHPDRRRPRLPHLRDRPRRLAEYSRSTEVPSKLPRCRSSALDEKQLTR